MITRELEIGGTKYTGIRHKTDEGYFVEVLDPNQTQVLTTEVFDVPNHAWAQAGEALEDIHAEQAQFTKNGTTHNMLWYDDDKTTNLEDKINRAVRHFEKKYKIKPLFVFLNSWMLRNDPDFKMDGLTIIKSDTVHNNHFEIGVCNDE